MLAGIAGVQFVSEFALHGFLGVTFSFLVGELHFTQEAAILPGIVKKIAQTVASAFAAWLLPRGLERRDAGLRHHVGRAVRLRPRLALLLDKARVPGLGDALLRDRAHHPGAAHRDLVARRPRASGQGAGLLTLVDSPSRKLKRASFCALSTSLQQF